MKKILTYLLLSSVSLPFISVPAKADTPTNSYVDIIDDFIDSNKLFVAESKCSSFLSGQNDDLDCTRYGLAPAIEQNHKNVISNYNDINTNKSNINNLGEGVAGSTALTAALSALPQMSKESKTTCGLGSGAYSSRYAVSFGCASMVSERIDINAGGSHVFGGSKSYGGGTLDSSAVRAGFVFKLGELNKPTQISFNDKKLINEKISDLETNNKNLKAKNDEIISQNQKLLARLEKLENIALKFESRSDMISVATKD